MDNILSTLSAFYMGNLYVINTRGITTISHGHHALHFTLHINSILHAKLVLPILSPFYMQKLYFIMTIRINSILHDNRNSYSIKTRVK